MAVWGAPIAHEDDAERAVRAALDLVDVGPCPAGPRRRTRRACSVRAGVTTGEAAVTIGATGQGMVAGDIVNTASRLQSSRAPSTRARGRGHVPRAQRRPSRSSRRASTASRARSAGVRAWKALRVVAQRRRRRADGAARGPVRRPRRGAPAAQGHCSTRRRARAAPGSSRWSARPGSARAGSRGSSSSTSTASSRTSTGTRVARSRTARGSATGRWARWSGRGPGSPKADDAATAAAKLEAVDRRSSCQTPRSGLDRAAARGPARPRRDAGGQREELFAAWRTLLRADRRARRRRSSCSRTSSGPTRASSTSSTTCWNGRARIRSWSSRWPAPSCSSAGRTGARDAGASSSTRPRAARTGGACAQLLAGLVPGLPECRRRRDRRPRRGHPALRRRDRSGCCSTTAASRSTEGGYRPAGDLPDLAVPEIAPGARSPRGSTPSIPRTGRCSRPPRSSARRFTVAGARGGHRRAGGDASRPGSAALVRRELLTLDADPRSPERGQYGFVQALIREVAYATLSRRDRRAHHLAAARYFEAPGDEELAGVLASHYLAAYRAAPGGSRGRGDRGPGAPRPPRRRRTLRRARTTTKVRWPYLAEARDVAAEPAERAAIDERAADFADTAGQHALAESHIDRAIEWHRSQGDRMAAARASTRRGRLRGLLPHRRSDRDARAGRGRDRRRPTRRRHGRNPWPSSRGAYMAHGDTPQGLEWSDRAIALAERTNALPVLADALVTRAWAVASIGRIREAFAILRRRARPDATP